MDSNLSWVTYAFSLVWLGLGGYISALLLRQKKLEKRVEQIEMLKK